MRGRTSGQGGLWITTVRFGSAEELRPVGSVIGGSAESAGRLSQSAMASSTRWAGVRLVKSKSGWAMNGVCGDGVVSKHRTILGDG